MSNPILNIFNQQVTPPPPPPPPPPHSPKNQKKFKTFPGYKNLKINANQFNQNIRPRKNRQASSSIQRPKSVGTHGWS